MLFRSAALKGEKVKPKRDVALRLDFLKLHEVEGEKSGVRSQESEEKPAAVGRKGRGQASIAVPRETGVWSYDSDAEEETFDHRPSTLDIPPAGAYLPATYVPDAAQRIEAYRKLAQAETKADVDALRRELQDRYGKVPAAVELLLLANELKLLAGERGLDGVETKGDKLMLHRRGDFIQLGGKFPRLTKTEPLAVLKEIKRLLLSL